MYTIVASMDRDVRWQYELPGTRPSKRNQRQSPTTPSVMPSVAPQRAAGASPAGAWARPLRPTPQLVHPSPLSKEDVGALIKMEVASRLEQYEQQPTLRLPLSGGGEGRVKAAEGGAQGQGGGDRQPQAGARSVERPLAGPGEVIGKFGSRVTVRVVAPGLGPQAAGSAGEAGEVAPGGGCEKSAI
jgi:hypothetical protein